MRRSGGSGRRGRPIRVIAHGTVAAPYATFRAHVAIAEAGYGRFLSGRGDYSLAGP